MISAEHDKLKRAAARLSVFSNTILVHIEHCPGARPACSVECPKAGETSMEVNRFAHQPRC